MRYNPLKPWGLSLLTAGLTALPAAAQLEFYAVTPEAPILVPADGIPFGLSSVYPSEIEVAGVQATIRTLEVGIIAFAHTYPADVTLLLEGPGGETVVLMSGCGGGIPAIDVDLFFSPTGNPIPFSGALTPGPHKPTACFDPPVLPHPAPSAPYGTSLNAFSNTEANGTWSLYAYDQFAGDEGYVLAWYLRITEDDDNVKHYYGGTVDVPVGQPDFTDGPGFPFPDPIYVTETNGKVIRSMTVRIRHVLHTWPGDMDILLVGPRGQTCILASDVGGGTPVDNVLLAFTPEATAPIPTPLTTGVFAPTDAGGPELWDAPAPIGSYTADLSQFVGSDPQGPWLLFASDDTEGDSGQILFWDISLYLEDPPSSCIAETTGDSPPRIDIIDLLTFLSEWFNGCD